MSAAPATDSAPAAPRRSRLRLVAGVCGVVAALAVGFLVASPDEHPTLAAMAGAATLMAVFWIFDVLPIAVTSLIPLALFPLLGVASPQAVAGSYGKPIIFLFLGGFILALGIERAGLHRRIALRIIHTLGAGPRRLVLGFMVSSWALSMWISNTAAVMVMLPIALAVLRSRQESEPDGDHARFATALMLGVAYAANIGGMATLVGTPPNLVMPQVQLDLFPDSPAISFSQWMGFGLPIAAAFLLVGWLLLTRVLFRLPAAAAHTDSGAVRDALRALGPVRRDELLTGLVFAAVALLWVTGSPIGDFPGWRAIDGLATVGDESVAIAGAILLFAIPSAERPGALMDWQTALHLPWGVLLLFGGGFALAAGFQQSGLSGAIGEGLGGLAGLPPWLLVGAVCLVMTFLTELTSNTATANLILPIVGKAAVAMGLDPRALMIPATLSASCAFMMPVATPTNAIVFGSGAVSVAQMARAGLVFNLVGVVLVTLGFLLFGASALDIDFTTLPAWATP